MPQQELPMNRFPFVVVLLAVPALCLCGQPPGGRRGPGGMRGGAAYEKPPLGKTDAEKAMLATLDRIRNAGEVFSEVPPADGRMLRLLAEAVNAQHVVEVGTSTGYSGLWICLALQKTGGKLTTLEVDAGRADMARKHFAEAGVQKLVTLIEGDAHETVKQLKGPIDMVFIDADKDGYVHYLKMLLPHVRPGGLITAHNVNMASDYVDAVNSNPDLETVYYMQGNALSVSLKKR
jgi:predicted O-methyltransferase YrrM